MKKSVAQQNEEAFARAFPDGRKTVKRSEYAIHNKATAYLRNKYPKIRFYSTYDGVGLSPYQAGLIGALRWANDMDDQDGRGVPDWWIFAARGGYSFLVIELKKDGASTTNAHAKKQQGWLDYLAEECGAFTTFAVGYEEAIEVIEWYLAKPKRKSK